MDIVLDGLSRSGTTLLSSIFNSSDNSVCYRGIFIEGLNISICKSWSFSHACKPILDKEKKIFIVKKESDLRFLSSKYISSIFKKDFPVIASASFFEQALKNIKRENQTQFLTFEEWSNIINKRKDLITSEESFFNNVDQILVEVRKKSNAKYAFWRWNNCLFMYNKWVKRKSHLWMMITRDPIASAISRNKIWGIPFTDSLKMSISYAQKYEKIKDHPEFKNIYFEDLINKTKKCFNEISEFTGLQNIKSENLKGQDGKPYRKETSDLGEDRKKGVRCDYIDPKTAFKTNNSQIYNQYYDYFLKLKKYKLYERYF